MRFLYLPAIVSDTPVDRWKLRPIQWYDDRVRGTDAYHGFALVAAPLWRRPRKVLADHVYLFGDSGGYQIINGADLDPVDVLRWQLLNADEGPILDHPPVEGKAPMPSSPDLRFRYSLLQTVNAVQKALPLYRHALAGGTSFRWWGACHGSSAEELQRWHGRLSEIHPFDREGEGWCFRPAPPNDPVALARIIRFVRENEIARIHVFIPGGAAAVATLLALGSLAGLDRLTWDNTSPITAANNRTLYLPDDDGLGWTTAAERFRGTGGRDRKVRKWMRRTCPCQSCRWMARDLRESPVHPGDEYIQHRMRYHNVLVALDVYRNLEREARRDPHGLLRRMLGEEKVRPVLQTFQGSAVPT